jgi:predicted PurR-regulated permease PerM
MLEPTNKLPQWLNKALLVTFIVVNSYLLFPVFQELRPVIVLIITAALLAFLLNYPVQLLTLSGLKRSYAITIVFLIVLIIVGILTITLVPLLLDQFDEFANRLPVWIDSATQQLQTFQVWAMEKKLPIDVSALMNQLEDRFSREVESLPTQIIDFLIEAFDSTLELFLVIVLTFYLLLHGQSFWSGIWHWFPDQVGNLAPSDVLRDRIQLSLQQSFQNYFLGQVVIASLMGLAITSVFLLLKVPFGLLFGLGIGVLVLIPLGDVLGIVGVSALMALKSVWLGGEILVVATIVDQAIDQAIAPRIFGSLVDLNPVWIIISLLLGAKLGGVLGLIIAVPVAATIKKVADSLQVYNSEMISENESLSVDTTKTN